MSPRRAKKPPELRVVLDTSAIFTGSASDLLRLEVADIIRANSKFPDLTVSWYLPEIVVRERQYQMFRLALALKPSIQKLERLLGHNLNITDSILEQRVAEAIKVQVADLDLLVRPLDVTRVDWSALMFAAVFRKPPFDPGENEKGFRDAIVAETFFQLLSEAPVTPKVCRMAMVTGDKLLAKAIEERTAKAANVRILETLEDLTGLITTLVAEVDEEFVAQLRPKAQNYFFVPLDESTLYYSKKLRAELQEAYQAELAALPQGATHRRNGKWLIAPPRFVRKQGQRIFWASRVTVEATGVSYVTPSISGIVVSSQEPLPITPQGFQLERLPQGYVYSSLDIAPSGQPSFPWITSSSTFGGEREVAKGRTVLEVEWSVAISTTSRPLSSPKIEGTKFIETVWE